MVPVSLSKEVGDLLRHLVGQGFAATADAAHKNKAHILQSAQTYEVTLAQHGEELLTHAIQNSDFGFLGDRLKPTLVNSATSFIQNLVAEAESEDDVLYDLIVSAVQNESKKLNT